MRKIVFFIFVTIAICFFSGCMNSKMSGLRVERAFYFWKNNRYSLNDDELLCIKNQQIQKLYVKFFEVEKNSLFGTVPTAKTELNIWDNYYDHENDSVFINTMKNLEIIPTVYIRNEIFLSATSGSIDTLADNMNFLIKKYYTDHMNDSHLEFKEIQIDCDWTEKTKDNYFYLLKKIKQISNKTISCTLRLYPYKYSKKLGVPPVDKATLMCYNLINPLSNEDKNSILNNDELESYLKNSEKYPLHLDIALPVFSWMQVYQNNQFAGIISPKIHELDSILKPIKPLWFEVIKDKEFDNFYLRQGDKIKFEDVSETTIKASIGLLKKYLQLDNYTVITLFHLDSDILNKYSNETIDSFYTDFSK